MTASEIPLATDSAVPSGIPATAFLLCRRPGGEPRDCLLAAPERRSRAAGDYAGGRTRRGGRAVVASRAQHAGAFLGHLVRTLHHRTPAARSTAGGNARTAGGLRG